MEENSNKPKEVKDDKPINALPDYEIRTMKDDLAELGLIKLEKETKGPPRGEEIEAAPKAPPIILPAAKEIKRESPPPEKLPIAPKKASLPSTEELITEKEELPRPPQPKFEPFVPEAKPIPKTPSEELPPLPKREELKIPEISYEPTTTSPKKKVLVLISIIIIALAGLGIGAYFFWPKETPVPPPPPPIITPQTSTPLISVNETKMVSLTDDKTLFELLKEETKLDQSIATFKRMAILKNEKEFFSLNEIFQNLEIPLPPYALSDLKTNYDLVIFNQATGKRLGIIAEVGNPENLKDQLKNWEPTILEDFKNFYPAQLPGPRASQKFLDDVHQNVAIRYVNLPRSDLTLNYTIISNLLIIGTSKELMYRAIDKVLGLE